jgi:hypothetical protein
LRREPRHVAHELAAMMHRANDWYELRLPDALIPVYYVLRPLLLVGRECRRLLQSRSASNKRR